MTVPVPGSLIYIDNADGVTTSFSYPVRFLDKAEIVVLLRDDTGDTLQVLGTDYTIVGSSWPTGGNIVFNAAPPVGKKVVRYRNTTAKQVVDLENTQRNDAGAVETQLDRLAMVQQDQGRDIGRSLKVPAGSGLLPKDHFPISDGAGGVKDGGAATNVDSALADLFKFRGQYLGEHASDPSTDANGNAIQQGAFYWNKVLKVHRYWDGDSWETFPFATVADGAVTEQKINDEAVSLDKLKADVIARIDAASVKSKRQRVFDFHFGVARGVGYQDGKDTGLQSYTLAASANAGDTSFSYTGTAPNGGTLIVLLGVDGKYYTTTTQSASAGTCTLRSPLPVAVAAGQNAWSFWNDDSHPNSAGFKAIVDYALRQDMAVWKKVLQQHPIAMGGTVGVGVANNGFNIGSATSNYGWNVTPSGAGTGCKWVWRPKKSGLYRAVFQISKDDPLSADVSVAVVQDGSTIGVATVKTNDGLRHEIDFFAGGTKPVTISATRASDLFIASDMVILEQVGEPIPDLNWGTHVILGDSWVTLASGGVEAALRARLDRANIIAAGVGGNRAEQALNRFSADVAPHRPDFVWVVVSTNDIAQGVLPAAFIANLGAIVAACQRIGATPILMTPFCGPSNQTGWIDGGRVYYSTVPYYETELPTSVIHSVSVHVPTGATVPILSLGLQNSAITVVSSYLTHAVEMREGPAQPTTGGTLLASIADDWITTPVTVKSDSASKFVQFLRTGGGADENVSGYIEVLLA